MPSLSEEEQHQYAQLAIKIFQKYRPEDTNPYDKMQKETKIPTCVMSGRPLTGKTKPKKTVTNLSRLPVLDVFYLPPLCL
jgi:hypothetical protein